MKPRQYEEQDLIALLSEKNEEAFNSLYVHYSAALYGIIFRIVARKEIAEEVLQDAFVKIYTNLDSYKSNKGRLFTWMASVCRNAAIDSTRKRSWRNAKLHEPETDAGNIPGSDTGIAMYDSIGIKNKLLLLSDQHRQLLDLVYFGGYTQSQISEELGVPLGTIKTRIAAAIVALKKNLSIPPGKLTGVPYN